MSSTPPSTPKRTLTAATTRKRASKPTVQPVARQEDAETPQAATEATIVVTAVVETQGAPEHVQRVPMHPPMYWRRWCFLAIAVFNYLLITFRQLGVSFTYGMPPPRNTNPIAAQIVLFLYYCAIIVGANAALAIGLGISSRRSEFRSWLHLALGFNMFVSVTVGLGQISRSVVTGEGYSEPLLWLLIAVFEFTTIMSAYDVEQPLPPFAVLRMLGRNMRRARSVQRWRQAVAAFRGAWHAGQHTPPESG